MNNSADIHGVINHSNEPPRSDYLFRVSLKAVIFNEAGEVLIVKEAGRDWWDIPGGGLNHGESIKEALARELYEEASLRGDFEHEVILVEDPRFSNGFNMYQMRVTFLIKPERFIFEVGEDGDEIAFIDPKIFENSDVITERKIFEYSQLAKTR